MEDPITETDVVEDTPNMSLEESQETSMPDLTEESATSANEDTEMSMEVEIPELTPETDANTTNEEDEQTEETVEKTPEIEKSDIDENVMDEDKDVEDSAETCVMKADICGDIDSESSDKEEAAPDSSLNDSIPEADPIEDKGSGSKKSDDNDEEESSNTVVVVTHEDADTKEILLRTTEGDEVTERTLTVQEVTDESGHVYFVETADVDMEDEDNFEEEREHQRQAKFAKIKNANIPSHVLGRNIINPSMDPFRNGKAPPKPRLGVKIPYRNLTSQIVSKQEITNEILKRSQRHNNVATTGQNLFAKRLTQTLAKKLSPAPATSKSNNAAQVKLEPSKQKKLNNSDLIAILEGDGDVDTEADNSTGLEGCVEMTKEMEREIALKQLSELPEDPPEIKPRRSSINRRNTEESKGSEESPQKKFRKLKNDEETIEDYIPKAPRFSNTPLKTYTRKRKPSDDSNTMVEKKPVVAAQVNIDHDDKIDLPNQPGGYITKSSRIIKKKVIWDPDEFQPKKIPKTLELPLVKERASLNSINKIELEGNDLKESSIEKKKMQEAFVKIEKKDTIKIDKKLDTMNKSETKPDTAKKIEVKKNELPTKSNSSNNVSKQGSPTKTEKIVKPVKVENPEKSPIAKTKKRFSEVSRLLMDEGAVNMLYSIKNSEDDQQRVRHKKSLKSKTNELLNDFATSYDSMSPKALRKKEGSQSGIKTPKKIVSQNISSNPRNKSRDSTRSSVQSPPGSPRSSTADASRIIRRHSSSSFSSAGGHNDDYDDEESEQEEEVEDVEEEQEIEEEEIEQIVIKPKRTKRTMVEEDSSRKKPKKIVEEAKQGRKSIDESDNESHLSKYVKYETFTIKKLNKLMEIVLKANGDKEVFMNLQMMQELILVLKELETDPECNVVVMTSSGQSFSNGINFKALISPKENIRKNIAKKMATNVRDFLLCLANFPKILIAGVHGHVIGLGVTMLPLFDMIIASNSSKFSTPYAKYGCMAEGGSLLSLPHLSQTVLVSQLLLSSQILSSEEAYKLGLVTKVLSPEKFPVELVLLLKKMSNQSAQFMEATKKQLRQRMIPEITDMLNAELEMLVQQWISLECQKNFSSLCSN